MNYVINDNERKEKGGTFFLEFQKGALAQDVQDDSLWREDSVYIHGEDWEGIDGINAFFAAHLEQYDYYDITVCDSASWESIVKSAAEAGGELFELISQLDSSVRPWLEECGCFSIVGM